MYASAPALGPWPGFNPAAARFAPRYGLGGPAPQQIVGMVSSMGAPVAVHFAAPAVASLLGISATLAVPIVGAAIAGITLGINALLSSGCGQACIVTSDWANKAEALLRENLEKYFSLPTPRPRSVQTLAVNNGRAVMQYLFEQCGQPGLSTAGRNCIGDRQAGACKWRQSADSPLLRFPGEPQPGECWNWDSGYIGPIAHDSAVVDDAALALSNVTGSVQGAISSALRGDGVGSLLMAAAVLGVVWGIAKL